MLHFSQRTVRSPSSSMPCRRPNSSSSCCTSATDGIAVADSITQAVSVADVVVTMLFDLDAVLAVTDELLQSLGPDAVWMQSATVGVDGIRRIAERASGAALLD